MLLHRLAALRGSQWFFGMRTMQLDLKHYVDLSLYIRIFYMQGSPTVAPTKMAPCRTRYALRL